MNLKSAAVPSLLFCVLSLAACGTTQNAAVPEEQKEMAIIAKEINKPAQEEKTVAALPDTESDPSITEEVETKEEPVQEIPKISVLMGKSVSEIETVFGKPNLRRKDTPAEVWQYLTSDCALHLIFYPESGQKSGKMTVQHISMNDRQKAVTADAKACFGSQLRKVGEERAQNLS